MCVALNKEKDIGFIEEYSDNEDDKHDEYNSRIIHDVDAQNSHCINQRKEHCFV